MASLSTVSILFCDLVGSTDLMTRLGDDATDEIRRACFVAWRKALVDHRGTEVKAQGDGLMACFVSAVDSVECAAALQVATARLDGQRPDLGLALRVGISAGDASFDDGDWYGIPVVEAARLCAAAEPGQILVADIVAALARSRSARAFVDAGAYTLKGLSEPLHAVSVGWERPRAAPQLPLPRQLARPDSAFAFFVGRHDELDRLTRGWKEVAAGERRCFFVAGEPGIGKTTLVAETARRAHEDGGIVLYGRCDQELAATASKRSCRSRSGSVDAGAGRSGTSSRTIGTNRETSPRYGRTRSTTAASAATSSPRRASAKGWYGAASSWSQRP